MQECGRCGLTIDNIPHPGIGSVWVVMGTNTTADGLSYCLPNPDGRAGGVHHPAKKEA